MAGPHGTTFDRTWRLVFLCITAAVLCFLMAPLLVIVPLSFNREPYLSFTSGMLSLEAEAFSFRWYREFLDSERWQTGLWNSVTVGLSAAGLSTVLGTAAAVGLGRLSARKGGPLMGIILSPLIVPVIITAAGLYSVYARIGLVDTRLGLVLAHTVLGCPFVVITVSASLSTFDRRLLEAGLSLGASPLRTFLTVTLPLILPGVLSGAVFAFGASFDEIAVALFVSSSPDSYTIPRVMWSGIREQISPAILAAATLLILLSVLLLLAVEWLRRRGRRLSAARV